jgi:hypothetical protein
MVLLVHYLQKNYGHGIGGRLIGLPITTGPFILIIYLQEGRSFAGHVAHGVLLGQIALTIYCWSYAKVSSIFSWWVSLLIGTLACLATGYITTQYRTPLWLTIFILVTCWVLAMVFWPTDVAASKKISSPTWELPARVLVTVLVLVGLSTLAPHLGASFAGALSTYPVISSVISAFNHRRHGPSATIATLRGLMETLPITVIFIAILALTL